MGSGVVDASDSGPKGRGVAHAATFGAGVEDATGEVMGAKATAGLADGNDFSVGTGVTGGEDSIGSFTDDSAIFYYDRAEGAAGFFDETTGSA